MRPFHEEMTASLLEEVGRRRTYQRPSETSGNQTMAAAVEAAVAAANAVKAATTTNANANASANANANITNANTTTVKTTTTATGGTSTVAAGCGKRSGNNTATTTNKLPGGMVHTVTPPLTTAVAAAETRPPNASLVDRSRSCKSGIPGAGDNNDGSGGGDESMGGSETIKGGAGATARQGAEAERRRAALATIENRRGRPSGSDERIGTEMMRFSAAAGSIVPAPSVASSSTISSFDANLKLSPAFSAQSVRSGAILGYYGREEVETLIAISKNPSRIAAYNRIIKSKRGAGRDEDDAKVGVLRVVVPPNCHTKRAMFVHGQEQKST